jgi:bifunctional DNA-binding transcriptional regulator/antitoxin component of YhaV-PrlF toxin-antitoxin module
MDLSKVKSRLRVTVPRAIAEQYRIEPGDELRWTPSGETIRVGLRKARPLGKGVAARLRRFDEATKRQQQRVERSERGWKRDDLYGRGGAH